MKYSILFIPFLLGCGNSSEPEVKRVTISIQEDENHRIEVGKEGDLEELGMTRPGYLTVRLLRPNPYFSWHLRERCPTVKIYDVKDVPTINSLGDKIIMTEFNMRIHPPTKIIFDYYREDKVARTYIIEVHKRNPGGEIERNNP